MTAEQLQTFAEQIRSGKRVSFWWTMGVNQSHEAVRTAQAIINLALLTGNIGRPGTGANSITGQCNAMGSRLFSNTTNLLGGHDFARPDHRQKIADALGIERDRDPATGRAWPTTRSSRRSCPGRFEGLWIVATNPAHSWINQRFFQDVAGRLDFLVVQDMYATTETAQLAHLVLPAAGWGEKDGTFINSERRIGLCKKVARAPGQALADFHIFRLIAEAWGCGEMFREWSSPEAVFQILKRCSRGQPCDITGIADYGALERAGGIQWPVPEGSAAPATERRLFEDGVFFHPDGKARFCHETPRATLELPSKEYPLVLLTGRGSSSQWHTQTRTKKSAVLRRLYPQGHLRGDQPGRRPGPEGVTARVGRGDLGARHHPRQGGGDERGAAGADLHPDALRDHEPADLRVLRSLFQTALVQTLRRQGAARSARPLSTKQPGVGPHDAPGHSRTRSPSQISGRFGRLGPYQGAPVCRIPFHGDCAVIVVPGSDTGKRGAWQRSGFPARGRWRGWRGCHHAHRQRPEPGSSAAGQRFSCRDRWRTGRGDRGALPAAQQLVGGVASGP